MESLDQHITPLGNHMPINVNFMETGNGYSNRNKKVSYEISGYLQQNIFCPRHTFKRLGLKLFVRDSLVTNYQHQAEADGNTRLF